MIPFPFHNLSRNIFDIITTIARFGKFNLFTRKFTITQQDGLAQIIHLISGIVNVIFPGDIVPDCFKQVADDVADNCAACVSDMQWSGGIGADKFHLNFLPGTEIKATEFIMLLVNIVKGLMPDPVLDEKIYKTRPGYLGFLNNPLRIRQVFQNDLRNFTRILFGLGSKNHRDICRIIAMLRVGRRLDLQVGQRKFGQLALLNSNI